MNERQKKILFLTYHFPPSSAIGGRRIAAFVKYLGEFGWQPYVVTIKDEDIELVDPASLEKMGRIPIIKAHKLPSLRNIYLRIKTKWTGYRNYNENSVTDHERVISDEAHLQIRRKLKRFLAALVFLPDEHRNWILPAAHQAIKYVRRENIDCLLTSCPPYSTHLAGLLVKLIRGRRLRWVADFRDPWMVPNEKEIYPTSRLSRWIEYTLEKMVIRRCDLVLTTTERYAARLAEYYEGQNTEKFVVVPNGYEPESLPVNSVDKYEIFTISYTGSLYFGRTPEPIFLAVKSLVDTHIISEKEIRIQLVGFCAVIDGVPTERVVERYGLEKIVRVIDPVPQKKAIEIIRKSHVALLLAPGQPFQIPGKTYEYIGLGIPILALTEEGATSDLINSVPSGRAVDPENVEAIKDYISTMLEKDLLGSPAGKFQPLQFTRRKAVEKLAGHLERLP